MSARLPRTAVATLLLLWGAGVVGVAAGCGAILGITPGSPLDGSADMGGGGNCGGYCLTHCGGSDMCGQACANNCSASPGWYCDGGSNACGCTHDDSWCVNRCGSIKDNCGNTFECAPCDGSTCLPDANPCATLACGTILDSCGSPTNCGDNGACVGDQHCDAVTHSCGDGGDDGGDDGGEEAEAEAGEDAGCADGGCGD